MTYIGLKLRGKEYITIIGNMVMTVNKTISPIYDVKIENTVNMSV